MAYLIIASTVPAALIGFLFEGFFEETVRSPWVVVFNFVLVGVLFIVGEVVGHADPQGIQARVRGGRRDRVRPGGGARAGVSRSGATITLGPVPRASGARRRRGSLS
jgi:undecaprenyl-diphosphatase